MEQNEVSKRVFLELLEYLCISSSHLSIEIGLESSVGIYQIKDGESKFSIKMAKRIINRWPEIRIVYLLLGTGTLLQKTRALRHNELLSDPRQSLLNLDGDNYMLDALCKNEISNTESIKDCKFSLQKIGYEPPI